MGLVKTIKFSDFAKEQTVRFDYKFINYYKDIDYGYYIFKELFDFIEYTKLDISKIDNFQYVEIGDISKTGDINPINLSFSNRSDENENYFKKIEKGDIIKPKKGDILLSAIRPYLNKNVLIQDEDYYFTKAMIQIRPKINSKLFYYTLRTSFFNLINAVSRQGKGYPTLKENDLKSIRFPKIAIDKLIKNEDILLKQIEPLEKEIQNLKSQKKEHLEIINDVFSEELKFDWDKFNEIKKEKVFISNLLKFSNNIDLRFSYNFAHKSHQYLKDFLYSKTNKKIKDFVKEDIKLGKTISPTQFDENGDCYYVSMATIKNYTIELDDSQLISVNYENDNIVHKLQKNDIIVSRSGVAIGKFALVENYINAINADFTIRIRLDKTKIVPLFAYYFFRSDFTQELIHFNKKGLQNKNIFPSQLQEFPILDFDLEHQQQIVDKIKTKIDSQKDIDEKIKNRQDEISGIIEDIIKGKKV